VIDPAENIAVRARRGHRARKSRDGGGKKLVDRRGVLSLGIPFGLAIVGAAPAHTKEGVVAVPGMAA
jgi:hypothetical protein